MRCSRAGARGRPARRGLVLVAAVGVLGVISVMGLAFATVMRLEARAARNFTEAIRAEFVARAGIEDAIARLRAMVRDGAELPYDETGKPAAWYTWRGTAGGDHKISFAANQATNGLDDDGDGLLDEADRDEIEELPYSDWVSSTYIDGGDNYVLRVEDAASKININAGDNLGTILDNLCRVIGPPLVAADQRALVPKWFADIAPAYSSELNAGDLPGKLDFFYRLDGPTGQTGRPITDDTGRAIFGDGYAIAGYRARHGEFLSVEDVRSALTWIERGDGDGDGDPDGPEVDTLEEQTEIEAKLAALRPYITISSYVDTDQIGYGKFEQIKVEGSRILLTDRNKTWNRCRNKNPSNTENGGWDGELKDCLVAIVNGVGQGQLKTIAWNSIDTIVLDESRNPGSMMLVPPNHESSYVIIGKDHRSDIASWQEQAKLYSRQPLSIHRAPVNVNTAKDKVLIALLMGLQTNWGAAGYYTDEKYDDKGRLVRHGTVIVADAFSVCPSVISLGRDDNNAFLRFNLPCPNDTTFDRCDANQSRYGHARGRAPFCFFCSFGRLSEVVQGASKLGSQPTMVNEAHYIAWQILKEREQTKEADESAGGLPNGYGPFKGWDHLYFRVFRPWERGQALAKELSVAPREVVKSAAGRGTAASMIGGPTGSTTGHPGVARLCMANFNSNTDILKFQPNIEWINRWGPNFTDLYMPQPWKIAVEATQGGGDVKLRTRPGELLDKTDLNIGTTEFCFDSGGIYEIESIGRVYDTDGVVAERKFNALVRIYDVWRESTQREFVAGSISRAEGAVGSRRAGQIAVDRVSIAAGRKGGAPAERKSLCTYPEPLVPGDYPSPANPAPLALETGRSRVQPAGYDGQILLATNSFATHREAPPDPDTALLDSFTGGLTADFAKGDPKPIERERLGKKYWPLDEVGLLGVRDSTDFDMEPVRGQGGVYIEGEGKGGDLRPDGCYFGVVGSKILDGSIEFGPPPGYNFNKGTITLWVKPTWHHGTYGYASLPPNYINDDDGSDEKGSTVHMWKVWARPGAKNPAEIKAKWPCAKQFYDSEASRDGLGYIRDRFEHEFFNGSKPGSGWGSTLFRFMKAGDFQNSEADLDIALGDETMRIPSQGGPGQGTVNFAALTAEIEPCENGGNWETWTWLPGHLAPDSKPFYRFVPYRWHYTGFIWNVSVSGRTAKQTQDTIDAGRHEAKVEIHDVYGQPLEYRQWTGLPAWGALGQDGETIEAGKEPIPYGHKKDRTAHDHLTWVMVTRSFVDTMRTWGKMPKLVDDDGAEYDNRKGPLSAYDLEDWAFEQYGCASQVWGGYNGSTNLGNAWQNFGINRLRPEGTEHVYQRAYSGTYAVIDEYRLTTNWPADPRTESGFRWPYVQRRMGRYYFAHPNENMPIFTSQTLYDSESSQSYTLAEDEKDDLVELGTVRWTVFTPYYCMHKPGVDDYEFPYDTYFADTTGQSRLPDGTLRTGITQAFRPSPRDWNFDPTSRKSSQRGCQVRVDAGMGGVPTDPNEWYTNPEAWQPITGDRRTAKPQQHARGMPANIRYMVRFRFSDEEYRNINEDTVLLDSPVFDDITITYMRRPKVLVWREVSE